MEEIINNASGVASVLSFVIALISLLKSRKTEGKLSKLELKLSYVKQGGKGAKNSNLSQSVTGNNNNVAGKNIQGGDK